jgi:hypothetical protein
VVSILWIGVGEILSLRRDKIVLTLSPKSKPPQWRRLDSKDEDGLPDVVLGMEAATPFCRRDDEYSLPNEASGL